MKYIVFWTPGIFELVATKKEGREIMKRWVEAKRTEGWVVNVFGDGYIARPPIKDDDPYNPFLRQAIVMKEAPAHLPDRLPDPA